METQVRFFVHSDGRQWFGRLFERLYQIAIVLPGDPPIVRSVRSANATVAREKLDALVAELELSGYVEAPPQPWPLPEPRAGAVIVVATEELSTQWILDALARLRPRRHGGNRYCQRFITAAVGNDLTACYFEVTGYETRDECAAFEDAWMFIDNFAGRLVGETAPTRFIVLSDVGLSDERWYAVRAIDQTGARLLTPEAALAEMGCSLDELRQTREHLGARGVVIWQQAG